MELQSQQSTQDTLFSLEELTVTKSRSMEQLGQQVKDLRSMIKDGYGNNQLYKEQEERVKSEKQQLKDIKAEIDATPSQASLLDQQKELQKQLKEKETEVSDYALEYARMANRDEFEKDGIKYQIVKTAKLIKRALS